MDLILINNLSSDRNINKVFGEQKNILVELPRNIDIRQPTLIIKENGFNIKDFNYFKIPEINRSYFINSVEGLGFNNFKIIGETDYLETFKTEILNTNCRMLRNIKTGDYQDINIDTESKTIETNHFSDVEIESNQNLILSTIVGG